MSRTKTPTQCPNCHRPEGVREILWGMPSFDEDLDKYWIGGCCVPERLWPKWHCDLCDYQWL